jgi:SAM-dependent methyltransferase
VEPRPTVRELAELYQRQGGHCAEPLTFDEALAGEAIFPNSTLDATRIVAAIERIAGKGRLLDVGCGYGYFASEAQRRGFKVDAIEIAPSERAVAKQMLGTEPLAVTFEDFAGEQGAYTGIVMSQVLEHAADPSAWLRKATKLLASGGVLGVAVPNFNSLFRLVLNHADPYVSPPAHLNYFTEGSFRHMAAAEGLHAIQVVTASRLRPDIISRRVPGAIGRGGDIAVGMAQRPVFAVADRAGFGVFLNAYVQKRTEGQTERFDNGAP